jgi:hypothetical protein
VSLEKRLMDLTASAWSAEELTSDGVWLIGVGALLVMIHVLRAGPQRGLEGIRMAGSSTGDRVFFAIGGTGALLVAVSSLLVAVADRPRALVIFLTAAGAVAAWLVLFARSGRTE